MSNPRHLFPLENIEGDTETGTADRRPVGRSTAADTADVAWAATAPGADDHRHSAAAALHTAAGQQSAAAAERPRSVRERDLQLTDQLRGTARWGQSVTNPARGQIPR